MNFSTEAHGQANSLPADSSGVKGSSLGESAQVAPPGVRPAGLITPAYLMRAWETVMPGFIPSASGILGLDPMERAGYLLYISGGDSARAFDLAAMAIGGSEGQEARKKWTDSARLLLECEPVQVTA